MKDNFVSNQLRQVHIIQYIGLKWDLSEKGCLKGKYQH